MQRSGRGIDRQSVLATNVFRKLTLKLLNRGTGGQPPGSKHLLNCVQLLFPNRGPVKWNEVVVTHELLRKSQAAISRPAVWSGGTETRLISLQCSSSIR